MAAFEKIPSTLKVPVDLSRLVLRSRAALEAKLNALGGDNWAGPITTKEDNVWHLKNGACVCWNADLGQAFEIHGAIYQRWIALGGMKWGVPNTDEKAGPDGAGRYNRFNKGTASISWTSASGAHAVWGAIHEKWMALGAERFGYPNNDETPTPDGVGRYNHFANNTGSIYWTPKTGAQAIWGEIRKKWASMGWERSYLGYPTSDEVDFADHGRANSFQHGGIYFWGDTGAIDMRDVVVRYTGLHCFGETDWDQGSDSDEPYFIFGVSAPTNVVTTVRTRVYDDVDGGESRSENPPLQLYRGVPYGLAIGTVLMENDFGDPDKYKAEVQKAVDSAHQAGVAALGFIPVVGPAVAAIAGPVLGKLMPALGSFINKLFDWGDDRVGSAVLTLTGRDLVLLATRGKTDSNFGFPYRAQTPLISGGGASYKAFFDVQVATS